MPIQQLPSPLDRIPNLEEVPQEKVRALEERLAKRMEGYRERMVADRERANELRKTALF